jgi:DNA polymerase I-like protein with 3'-5' exonuclease and polymerase domains
MTVAKALPLRHTGPLKEINILSTEDRKKYKLAHADSIIEINGDQTALEEAVQYCLHKKVVAFDLETSGLNPWRDKIVLVQIGDEDRQYLIWYETIDPAPITKLLGDKSVCKVGVNLLFDLSFWLVKHGLQARAWNVADAQIVEQIIGCGLFMDDVKVVLKLTSMAMMAKRWFGVELDKEDAIRTEWGTLLPGHWHLTKQQFVVAKEAGDKRTWEEHVEFGKRRRLYAADDVVFPIKLLRKQKPWVQELGLAPTVNLEHRAIPVVAEMRVRGMRLDQAAWKALADEELQRRNQAQADLDNLFGVEYEVHVTREGNITYDREINYDSVEQLKGLIYNWMLENYEVHVIGTNQQFKNLLLQNPKVNVDRIDKLFQPSMVPHPTKKDKQQRKGYPEMSDILKNTWDMYKKYLPRNSFMLAEADSDTLQLMRIIHETEDREVDPELPTRIGLPPKLVDPILQLRGSSKNVSTYGYSWFDAIEPSTGRIHFMFNQAALVTGRYSAQPNSMNFPADQRYRSCFVSAPGYKIVGSDYSQIEPRIIAQVSEDATYMRVFHSEHPDSSGFRKWCRDISREGKLDLYTEIGKLAGVIPPHFTAEDCKGDTALPEGKLGRSQAKILVLMLGYGGGKDKFWISLMLDTKMHWRREEADHIYDSFFAMVKQLKDTLDSASSVCQPKDIKYRNGGVKKKSSRRKWHPFVEAAVTWSEAIGGRKRFFSEDNPTWWTQGRNHPIQATGANILKEAQIRLTYWAWENGIDGGLVNLAHDEYLAEVAEPQAEMYYERMTEIMEQVGSEYCPDVPIAASGYIDTCWLKD